MLICELQAEDSDDFVAIGLAEGWIISTKELVKTRKRYKNLCYGAYEDSMIAGGITGYLHEKSAWIGNFILKPKFRRQGVGYKLFQTLFAQLLEYKKSIYLHAAPPAVSFYKKFGFVELGIVARYELYRQEDSLIQTNTSKDKPAHSDYNTNCQIDSKIFSENRDALLFDIMDEISSRVYVAENAFCHSKIICDKTIIGPFEMSIVSIYKARDLLQRVLYDCATKTVCVDVPVSNSVAVVMYTEAGFKRTSETHIMLYGEKIPVNYNNVFAFASLGSKG